MAEPEDKRPEDEEEEEEEIDDSGYKTVKDAVLFAIDVSSSMLEKPDSSGDKKADRDSATSAALKCAYQLMQQRIISSPKDMMGILLFGTKESKFQDDDGRSSPQYPHCYLLSDLDVPEASDVKRLRNLVEDEGEASKLLIPSTATKDDPSVAMAHVLFCANQIFTTKAPNFSSRRLFLVTDNDNPHSSPADKDLRRSATVRAKDLYDLGVIIELFPISRPGEHFDRSKFYDDIVYRPPFSDPDAPAPITTAVKTSTAGSSDGITLLQSLLAAINSRATPRRAQFSVPLEISPDLKISVKGHILIKRQEKVRSCYVWLNDEVPQIAVASTAQIADDTARTVEKVEIRRAYKFGGETVTFSKEEATKLRSVFGDPTIRIIGFKPLDLLPNWANERPPYFIYPSEDEFIGSTRTFAALHASLLKKSKFALCWFVPRRNATPLLAALIPGKEEIDEATKEQVIPPGLWAIPLPYADDVRQNPDLGIDAPVKAPDVLIDKMRPVIQQLQLPKAQYDPSRYPNPSLQWFYRCLQAMALEEDLPEKPEDKTVPKYRQIDKRAGDYVIEWGKELEAQYKVWADEHRHSTKREANSTGPAPKRARTTASTANGDGDGISDETMKKAWGSQSLDSFTMPVLKAWLTGKNQSTSGKKQDLVDRVEAWFEQKG